MDKNTININKLPSKTWYWLHMNDTKVSWNPDIAPCKVTVEEAFEDKERQIRSLHMHRQKKQF